MSLGWPLVRGQLPRLEKPIRLSGDAAADHVRMASPVGLGQRAQSPRESLSLGASINPAAGYACAMLAAIVSIVVTIVIIRVDQLTWTSSALVPLSLRTRGGD